MSETPKRVAFIRALIAAAWADGDLSPNEIRTLSYYLQLLDVRGGEYEQVKDQLAEALSPEQALELLEQQLAVLTSSEEKETLVAAVQDLLVADHELVPEETAFLQHLHELTSNVSTAKVFVSRLKELWSSAPTPRKRRVTAGTALHKFLQKRLLEYFRGRIALSRARSGQPVDDSVSDRDLYRSVVWAGLLSRVAHADARLCPAERDQLLDILAADPSVPRPDLEVLVGAFFDGELADVDLPTLVKEFNRLAGDDGSSLLDCLFLVAAADGELRDSELEVIRKIAAGVGFGAPAYRRALDRARRRLEAGWN